MNVMTEKIYTIKRKREREKERGQRNEERMKVIVRGTERKFG